jgi:hypothetical protein
MSKRKKSPLSKPSSSLKMKPTQLTSEAVSEFLESAVFNGMLMLTEKEVITLICQLAEHNVYDPAGDIDTDLVPVGTDYHKVLTRLKDFVDNIVK